MLSTLKIGVAALLLALPLYAQQQVTSPRDAAATGTLTTITTDTVPLSISGGQWATVQFMATTAGTATTTAQTTNDGTNWLPSPYARRLNSVSANPTVQAISATTLVANDIWEVALPANVVAFRLLCAASGTTTSVVVRAGQPYVPGLPVVAVLYDVTEGSIGAGLTTGTIDVTGWGPVQAEISTPTTQVWTVRLVDDAGSLYGAPFTTTAATFSRIVMTQYSSAGGPGPLASGVGGVWPFADKRINLTLPAGGTVSTGRARLVARR